MTCSPCPLYSTDRYDDIDMMSVNEVSLEFSAANEMLTESIKSCRKPVEMSSFCAENRSTMVSV